MGWKELEENAKKATEAMRNLQLALDMWRGQFRGKLYYVQLTHSNNWLKMHGYPKNRGGGDERIRKKNDGE